ncbi:tetratricopeptide repeat protein [Kitasatospora viridis]|uniref:NB-ARC domain-containing protein n=1 Tax=Kitasatospora viridis TaxID=281105 RepID=A0A561UDC3_9ACTN|nr:tetratricopeptide repeat protein [Kitasatospora viridis]TWF97357.1 NB-ARC domain-containing protein [Kitasatospora viridis]
MRQQVLPPVTPVLHDTLRREPHLVGRREEVADLLGLLAPGPGTATPVVVLGMGGIGKTALALATAHTARRARSFTAYYYLDFDGYAAEPAARLTADQAITVLLRNLGLGPREMPADPVARADRYHAELAAWSDRGDSVLLVADNISGWDQVRELLPVRGHRILVTTRTMPATDGEVTVKHLGPLASGPAQEILESQLQARRFAQDPAAKAELAGFCGGLPLALELVVGLLRLEPQLPPRELVERLAQEQERLDELTEAAGAQRDLRTVFGLSVGQLGADEQRLFTLLALAPGDRTGLHAAAALADLSPARTRRLLTRLRAANLLTGDATHHRFHELVRLYARQRDDASISVTDRTAATDRLLDHYTGTARAADSHLDLSKPDDPRFDGRGEALEWLRAEWRQLVAATEFAVLNDRAAHGRDLGRAVSTFLEWETLWDALQGVVDLRLAAVRRLGDREGEAAALRSLGTVLDRRHRFAEAVESHRESLRIARGTGNRDEAGRSLLSLGISLHDSGRYEEARQVFTEALAEYVELGDRHSQAILHHDLGLTLSELGDHRGAVEQYELAVAGYREFDDQYREAMVLRCWGQVLTARQDHAGSLLRNEQSLALSAAADDRAGQAAAHSNISLDLAALGRADEALAQGRAAVDITEGLHDPWLTGQVLANLLAVSAGHERWHEYHDVAERMIEIHRELDVPARVAVGLTFLGRFHIEVSGQPELGMRRLREALENNRAGGTREDEANILTVLAHGHHQLGEVDQAVDGYRRAAELHRALGNEPGLATAIHSLGGCCFINGRLPEAIGAMTEALPLDRRLGRVADEAEAHSMLGNAHQQLREFAQAEEHFGIARELHHRVGNRPREAHMLMALGDVCLQTGRPDDAVPRLVEARAAFHALGDQRLEALMLSSLGSAAISTGRHPDAAALFREALDAWLALGDEAEIARCRVALVGLCGTLGDMAEAVRQCELALPLLERLGRTEGAAMARAFLAQQSQQ